MNTLIKYHCWHLIGWLSCILVCSESYLEYSNSHTRSLNEGFCNWSWDGFYFVVRILKIHGATRGWTTWELSGDQWLPHVFKAKRGWIDVSIPMWEWMVTSLSDCFTSVWQEHHFVIRQSQLSDAGTLFGSQWVPIGQNKYMLCGGSIFVQVEAAAVDTLSAQDW